MTRYFVTGGTGLIGSNICRLLVESGDQVRALVRPGSDYGSLSAIGVETCEGDVRSADDMVRTADGCDAIINAAALLGGATQNIEQQRQTNVTGSLNAYDAGAAHRVRVVTLSSTPFLDHRRTLSEESPVAERWSSDPYTVTKGEAYIEAKRRISEDGADIIVVIPGGTFGPGLSVTRAMGPTSFNRAIRGALNGKLTEYITYPVPWVCAEDVALVCVKAVKIGVVGPTYLAFGLEDAQSTASWLNVACEVAGVAHRVTEVQVDPSNPEHVARFGATLIELSQREFPVPWFDNSRTRDELGYGPRPLRWAMEQTIGWLRDHGQIS